MNHYSTQEIWIKNPKTVVYACSGAYSAVFNLASMKTSVNLVRKLNNFDVIQRTSDGMFNANMLLKQWNTDKSMKKEVYDYMELKGTKKFINSIMQKENYNTGELPYLQTRGKNGGTWMHPLLFIDFAMWINPDFKYDVLRFVYDNLIAFRNKIGDKHISAMKSISILNPTAKDYSIINKGINCIVFGKSHKDIRNTATEEQMDEIHKIQNDIELLVTRGYIHSVTEVVDHLRKEFKIKNNIPF